MTEIRKMRMYLNDKDGSKFTDGELLDLLSESGCLYCAVAEGWGLLATRVEVGGTKKYSTGAETYEKTGAGEQMKAYSLNAEHFKRKCTCLDSSRGSSILIGSSGVDFGW